MRRRKTKETNIAPSAWMSLTPRQRLISYLEECRNSWKRKYRELKTHGTDPERPLLTPEWCLNTACKQERRRVALYREEAIHDDLSEITSRG